MPKDIRIIPNTSGQVIFKVYGVSQDTGLMLLQRLYTILLSPSTQEYRSTDMGYTLLDFLEGGNIPTDQAMNSILAISCANAVQLLDQQDREKVESFTGQSIYGQIQLTLDLTDGTTLKGTLSNG